MAESFSIEVPNRRVAIAPAIEEVEAWLGAVQAPPKIAYFVNLAMEEWVTNCIQYGYSDDREHTIVISLTLAEDALTMQMVDDGQAFDPLSAPPPDLSANLLHRPEGGLGIHLLRSLADRTLYERRNGTNRLTLVKNIQ